jgi:hypothetical protein
MFRRDLLHTGRATKTSKITVPKERWSVFTRGLVESSAAVGDVDGDGVLEVVVGSYDGNLYAYHGRTGPSSGAMKQKIGSTLHRRSLTPTATADSKSPSAPKIRASLS